MRNLLVFLAFLCVVTLVIGSQSKTLDLAIVFVALGLYLIGSVIVLVKSFAAKPGERGWRSSWGNQLACLPRSWQRWLLSEPERPEQQKPVSR